MKEIDAGTRADQLPEDSRAVRAAGSAAQPASTASARSRGYLRTKDLARAEQISVQQVRNYEAAGMLPAVERSASGYRRYTQQHLRALTTARKLGAGYGWAAAQQIMQQLHRGQLAEALAVLDQRQAELNRSRQELEQTHAALNLLASQLHTTTSAQHSEALRAGAAARLVGVRVSALRFWEQQGLLQPRRERGSNYRLYDEAQCRRLRIVALLRQANYDFAAIRATLAAFEAGQPRRVLAAIEQRRSELARVSLRRLEASAALYAYIDEFLAALSEQLLAFRKPA